MTSLKLKVFDESQNTLLAKTLMKLRDHSEINNFLKDLLTPSEFDLISQRLSIAKKLDKGSAYKEIERTEGVSSATIAKVSESIKYGTGGMKLALERMK